MYSTKSTAPNEQIQINTNKDIEQINNNKEISSVNTTDQYINVIHSLFIEKGEGLFNKDDVIFFTDKILEEASYTPNDPEAYFNSVVEMIVNRRKKKLGIIPTPEVPFYNWLEH